MKQEGKPPFQTLPCVLAIGGLDPGGGAGILADVRAITDTGAFGCAAAATLTVQSTSGLREVSVVPAARLLAQCHEVLRHQRVRAFKIGALGSAANVRAIADLLERFDSIPAVVDPVMLPTRGRAPLLAARAVGVVRDRLLPCATLLTANAPEAEALTGLRVSNVAEARDAAIALVRLGARAVLVKGGHLRDRDAVDVLAIGCARDVRLVELASPRLPALRLHGGGCTFASLVAGRLARSSDRFLDDPTRTLISEVRWTKRRHHAALTHSVDVGGALRVLR